MKNKGLETYLYTTIGLLAMLGLLIAVNVIGSHAKVRVDLTADHQFTLSDGTKKVLAKLDTPVQIRFYCTRGNSRMPAPLKNYAQRVQDLLDEFRLASKGKVQVQNLDPEPDTDAEDSARLDGIDAVQIGDNEVIYMGLSVTMLDQKEAIPFLSPDAERSLEYDVARAISRVASTAKPVIGVMSPLPVNGMGSPMMAQMGRQSLPPWYFVSDLKKDYTVKTVNMSDTEIPADVKVLVVIHPKGITDEAQYAIDQFVLRGGKLIALLDPVAVGDPEQRGMMGGASSSSMDKLLKAWGFTFDTSKVVGDMNYIADVGRGRTPAVITMTDAAVDKNDVLTANLDNLFLLFPGAFTGSPAPGLTETVLVKSSTNSQLIDGMLATMGGENMEKDFKSSGVEYPLAIKLTGKFKTAFPDGKPKAAEPPDEAGKPPEKKPETPAAPGLKESKEDTAVILIGDSDLLQNQWCVQMAMDSYGKRLPIPSNGNLALVQGAVDQFAGDSDLITVRSRATVDRPFTVVKKIQAEAQASYQSKIKELEASRADTEKKLGELLRAQPGEKSGRVVLSPEMQSEITALRKKSVDTGKELREVSKKLHSDIDSLETWTKVFNIWLMPIVVILTGVALALFRRGAQAAR